ncbi:MAG: hypothetical protein ACFBSG_17455 [Leptolyngbyaceae cyanobacterium]
MQEHCIEPLEATTPWQLRYRSGAWVLQVNGIAQIKLSYAEVLDFLERRAQSALAQTSDSNDLQIV